MSVTPKYIIRRLVEAIPLMVGLLTLVFFLSRLLPGDVTWVFLAPNVPPSVVQQLRTQFGLDLPLYQQYFLWLASALQGDFGYSFSHNAPVADVLWKVFPNTVVLGLSALILEVVLALSVAIISIRAPGTLLDRILSNGMIVLYTVPSFWVGMLLLSIFAHGLGIFPSSQMFSMGFEDAGLFFTASDLLWHLILPSLTIALPGTAGLARLLRSNMEATLARDYVVAARSMGIQEKKILRSYVLPNAVGPMVSLIGVEIGILLTGTVVTETLFAWPGMGRVAVVAIFARDYPLILGCTVIAGMVVIIGNLIADILNAFINPTIRTNY